MTAATFSPANGWVLYDGACGFCSRWVPRWRGVLGRHGYAIEALQASWVRDRLGLPEDDLMRDVLLLLPDGAVVRGAEVYRDVMRSIWWARPLYAASSLPLLRQVFDAAYRRFADNRYWISRACHMPAKTNLDHGRPAQGRPRSGA